MLWLFQIQQGAHQWITDHVLVGRSSPGPVADSRVDAILQEYRRSYGDVYANSTNLNKLAKQLKYPVPEYIQYCFCTEKGIRQLILDL